MLSLSFLGNSVTNIGVNYFYLLTKNRILKMIVSSFEKVIMRLASLLSLSLVETEYVDEIFPKILKMNQHYLDMARYGGCRELRQLGKEIDNNIKMASSRIRVLGVTDSRQKLLEDIVFFTNFKEYCQKAWLNNDPYFNYIRMVFSKKVIRRLLKEII